ncbi:MAG: dihydroorotate dehydrogenase electron transfer subunit [Nitrososphaerota archaeon]|nr:dihydroorotate dehydrogenase electron transfer subunit [Nitrososphaerota archaeon]
MHLAARIESIINVTSTTKVYRLGYRGPSPGPGQFFMVWIPRVGEIPLSTADYEDGELLLAITRRGRVTGYIHENLRVGDRIYLRGPYGKGFNLPRGGDKTLLVGGGAGAAPLLFLAETIRERGGRCDALLGFRSGDEAFFLEEFKRSCGSLFLATDDGSMGSRGVIPDVLRQILGERGYDAIYLCGPEPMMAEVADLVRGTGLRLEASLERYMRCGVGICGTCVLDPLGLRVCRDGPVFPLEVIVRIDGFGRWWRGFDSRKTPI